MARRRSPWLALRGMESAARTQSLSPSSLQKQFLEQTTMCEHTKTVWLAQQRETHRECSVSAVLSSLLNLCKMPCSHTFG